MAVIMPDKLLLEAVLAGDLDLARQALAGGADPDAADGMARTALYHAAHLGNTDMMQLLLDKDADIHLADDEGFSPLHAAVAEKHFKAADFLLENDANINLRDGEKRLTPLHVAFNADLREERTDRVMYLLEKGADTTLKNARGQDVLRMGDDYARRWPFAGEIVTYIEEFVKARELKARREAEAAEEARLKAFEDAAHAGLVQDIKVKPVIRLRPRKPGF